MKVPISTEQFLSVFKSYNHSVFPMQLIILILGFLTVFAILQKKRNLDKLIGIILAFIWLWAGVVYHLKFFSGINKAPFAFGALFIIQGIIFLSQTFFAKDYKFSYLKDMRGIIGLFLVFFGFILYPIISWITKGTTDLIISAGLPCPTVIATFGFLALTFTRVKWYVYIIPVLWSLVGISAALNFGIYQDFTMLLAAIVVIIINRNAKYPQSASIERVKEDVAI